MDRRSRWMGALIALSLALVLAHFAHEAWVDPKAPYLARDAAAEWITFPAQPSAMAKPAAELPSTFAKDFEVAQVPASARLRVRMHREGSVEINGRAVELASDANWKEAREVEVAQLLVRGANRIVVTARSHFGPPALWLALEGDGVSLRSDASWSASAAGSSERLARLARTPMTEWSEPSSTSSLGELRSDELNPRPSRALRELLVPLFATFAAAAALVFGLRRLARVRGWRWDARAIALLVAVAASAHAALFWNDRHLRVDQGFDAPAHLEYVEYVRAHGRVPLADEGWEMYQPPLYYALAAGALRIAGLSAMDADAAYVLRALGWLALALQLGFAAATLRLLFEERGDLVWSAVLIAAALPMQLYLFQFVTNESWAATTITIALYCAVRVLRRPEERALPHLALGCALGAALLTKSSALLVALLVLAVLAGRLVLERRTSAALWLRTLGLTALATLAVCGWYYARVHAHFGAFLVWNFDPLSGFAWWQDPGYHTWRDYSSFGTALERPLFSGVDSVGNALYSTCFGDGMLGGSGRVDVRPPWNYRMLALGTWLGIPLSLAIAGGALVALVRLVRAPRAPWLLVLSTWAAMLFALLSLTISLPFFGQAKAVYASSVVVPLGAAAALGVDALASRFRRLAPVLWTFLVGWGLWSFASFWSAGAAREEGVERAPSADTVPAGADLLERLGHDPRAALEFARSEVARAPDQAWAHRNLALVLLRTGDSRGAISAARDALALSPWLADVHALLSAAQFDSGDVPASIEQLEFASRLEPAASAYALRLARFHEAAGDRAQARRVLERTRAAMRSSDAGERALVEQALTRLADPPAGS